MCVNCDRPVISDTVQVGPWPSGVRKSRGPLFTLRDRKQHSSLARPFAPLDSASHFVLRFSRDGRAGRRRLRMCTTGAHLVGVTNSCPRGSAWWMAWPAWCSASWRVVRCSAGCGSAMRGSAHRCRGQLSRATLPRSSSTWLSAAAFAILSDSDTTAIVLSPKMLFYSERNMLLRTHTIKPTV